MPPSARRKIVRYWRWMICDGRDVDRPRDLLHRRRPGRGAKNVVREISGDEDRDQARDGNDPEQG